MRLSRGSGLSFNSFLLLMLMLMFCSTVFLSYKLLTNGMVIFLSFSAVKEA